MRGRASLYSGAHTRHGLGLAQRHLPIEDRGPSPPAPPAVAGLSCSPPEYSQNCFSPLMSERRSLQHSLAPPPPSPSYHGSSQKPCGCVRRHRPTSGTPPASCIGSWLSSGAGSSKTQAVLHLRGWSSRTWRTPCLGSCEQDKGALLVSGAH